MRRAPLLALLAVLTACEATAPPPPAQVPEAQRQMTERVMTLGRDIDELGKRYESLLKQNTEIEKLLGQLGFTVQMSGGTVAQRVEMMRRFERAEAARTATFEKLRGLLRTLATQHKVDTAVEARAGQIVVRLAEAGLFDPAKGRLRAEATPLLWAVAEGLKEITGRRFEVAAEVVLPTAAPAAATATGKAKAKAARVRGKAAKPADPWATAAGRAQEVVRLFEGAGIAAERLPRLFDAFLSTKRTGAHVGMGLANVKRIVEALKGKVSVQSEPGKGSTFTLTFPRGQAPAYSSGSSVPSASP